MKILVTGTAGFIGFHLAKRLLENGDEVIGLDNINDYYDVKLKYARLLETGILENNIEYNKFTTSTKYPKYRFIKLNLEDRENLHSIFKEEKFDIVCNLAAQAGVRYSIENPYAYIDSNIIGFINILEGCRHNNVKHLVYASSSSVYGMNAKVPFSEEDKTDEPVSLYAATKKANELMAHTYNKLYNLRTTGLRFFTVYGPWGRPDMAPMLFANALFKGESIKVFNSGKLSRDFTYIDDVIEGLHKIISNFSDQNIGASIFNIGCSSPIQLLDFISTLEHYSNKKAYLEMYPMQKGDVLNTYASTKKLLKSFSYKPKTNLKKGIKTYLQWYKMFYNIT